ncbi:hypothetical protein TeGR_g2545 [Tetraparma gracilis]|uniref:RAP domain-containing protein n=1 Tax=Tetraparma gracilis TaxID=2962635 RepID=A0ABQ6N3F5_9STRA|nr:hypothetical protein TeGR_g2545 [Tetraparma gracilis]
MLSIFSSDSSRFDSACFAMLMTRLGRLRKSDAAAAKRDERYLALLAVLPSIIQESDSKSIAHISNALAKLNERRAHPIMAAVENRAITFVESGEPQHLAVTALAFAKLRFDAPYLFSAINARADWLVSNSKHPQAIASTAWAFATLRRDAPALFAAIDGRADWLANGCTASALSDTAWAFATLRVDAPAIFRAIDARADKLVEECDPQQISNTAVAFAELDFDAPHFWTCLERRSEAFAAEATPQATCTTAWALAISGRASTNSELLRVLWDKAMAAGDSLKSWSLNQLVQVGLHAAGERTNLRSPPELQQRMLRSAADTHDQANTEFEDHVARHLTEMGVEYKREFPPFGTTKFSRLHSVDFALAASDGTKTAIECDGPFHFLHGRIEKGTGRETGRTVAKRRLLERKGWRVINLPWFERRRLEKEGKLQEWLSSAIN